MFQQFLCITSVLVTVQLMRRIGLWKGFWWFACGFGVAGLLLPGLPACAQKTVFRTLDKRRLSAEYVDRTVVQLMDSAGVPGLAVALLDNNKVSYLRTYGQRNVAEKPH